jgi:hypothetical protein
MYLHLYLRKGKVIIPTLGAVHQRLHRDIEPVAVLAVADAEGIRQTLHRQSPVAIRRRRITHEVSPFRHRLC